MHEMEIAGRNGLAPPMVDLLGFLFSLFVQNETTFTYMTAKHDQEEVRKFRLGACRLSDCPHLVQWNNGKFLILRKFW